MSESPGNTDNGGTNGGGGDSSGADLSPVLEGEVLGPEVDSGTDGATGTEVAVPGRGGVDRPSDDPLIFAWSSDLPPAAPAAPSPHRQATGDAAAAASGGGSRGGGSRGGGGGSGKSKGKRRKGSGSRSGRMFALFGFTFNVDLFSGNALVKASGKRAHRRAQAARLSRGGRNGGTRKMRRRMHQASWLDRALGGGR